MEEASWRRKLGGGIMEEESGKHLGSIWEAAGGIWRPLEASGRHLGGIWEAGLAMGG